MRGPGVGGWTGWLRSWWSRIVSGRPAEARDAAMDAEMAFHLEMEERELVEAGHDREEARRLARVRFGGVERHKEAARAGRAGNWLDEAVRDARYAVRGMRQRPGFAVAVLATLAVGIGAATAVFSVLDGVLLRPLPYPDGDRLVALRTSWSGEPVAAASPAEYFDYVRGTDEVFSAIGAYTTGTLTVAADGRAERVPGAGVASGVFEVVGTPVVAGRTFTAEEDHGNAPVVVLSEGYWQRRFGGDPDVVGGVVRLNGAPHTVIGIASAGFGLPESLSVEGARPALFLPLGLNPDTTYQRGSHYLDVVGRLAPGVTVERAADQVERVVDRFMAAYPDEYEADMGFRATAIPLREAVVGDVRSALMVAIGAVLLVLLVVAANVAALLVARGEARRGEMALRSTLGARRPRLIRQLLVESLVLGLAGGALGALVAWISVEALVTWGPAGIPRLQEVGVNGRALGFAGGVAILSGILFGLLPALQMVPGKAAAVLRTSSRTTAGGGARLRRALVAGEVALALTLVVGAGLLARSMSNLLGVDTGLEIENVVTTPFTIASARYPDDAAARDFTERLVERVSALPSVEAAAAVNPLPLASPIGDLGVSIPGRELPGDGSVPVDWQVVTPGYDRAMGLTLLQGRWIQDSDRAENAGAVVVNRQFADRYWPDGDALGATITLSAETQPSEARIVGVVENIAHEGPAAPVRPQIFLPHRQFRFWYGGDAVRSLSLVARSAPGRGSPVPDIRRTLAELDPEMGIGSFLTMEEAYSDVLARPRFMAALLSAFAGAALLLAVIGVYGVTAYTVRSREREFGIRIAMGARARTVTAHVIREALGVSAAGVAAGLGGALLLTRWLGGLLYGVSPTDPLVLATGAGALSLAAVVAAWLPARRAASGDPAGVLRAE